MEPIVIEGTKIIPTVNFSYVDARMEISGRSIPENAVDFYKPLIDWMQQYYYQPKPSTEIHLRLEYFNTSSSKCILDILRMAEKLYNAGNEIKVFWYYEGNDEDMLEAGEDYESMLSFKFNMVEYDDSGYL